MSKAMVEALNKALARTRTDSTFKVYVIPILGDGDIHALTSACIKDGAISLEYEGYGLTIDTRCGDWIKSGGRGQILFSSDDEHGAVLMGTEATIMRLIDRHFDDE